MPELKIGLIGCGHWGPNYIRHFQWQQGVRITKCADRDPERLKQMSLQYPDIELCQDSRAILEDAGIDAVVVATPATTHYELVKQALESGKDVLCEKPIALTAAECDQLVTLAQQSQRILMVGHTFIFNTGIQYLRKYIEEGLLGQLYYIYSTRTNLGPIRYDVNAVFDLATHDISIFNYLLGDLPLAVSARGQSYLQKNIEDVAFITYTYPHQILVHAHVSWLDPIKVRRITLVGSKRMVVWDDINLVEPIRVYDVGIINEPYYADFGHYQLLSKQGDITIPRINLTEPLKTQVQAFITALQTRQTPVSDGLFALGVTQTLEATQQSLGHDGQTMSVISG